MDHYPKQPLVVSHEGEMLVVFFVFFCFNHILTVRFWLIHKTLAIVNNNLLLTSNPLCRMKIGRCLLSARVF